AVDGVEAAPAEARIGQDVRAEAREDRVGAVDRGGERARVEPRRDDLLDPVGEAARVAAEGADAPAGGGEARDDAAAERARGAGDEDGLGHGARRTTSGPTRQVVWHCQYRLTGQPPATAQSRQIHWFLVRHAAC